MKLPAPRPSFPTGLLQSTCSSVTANKFTLMLHLGYIVQYRTGHKAGRTSWHFNYEPKYSFSLFIMLSAHSSVTFIVSTTGCACIDDNARIYVYSTATVNLTWLTSAETNSLVHLPENIKGFDNRFIVRVSFWGNV